MTPVKIDLKIERTAAGWSCIGEEFVRGELCGAVNVSGASSSDLLALLNMVFAEYD